MQLCIAIPLDIDQAPGCPARAIHPLPFCREHAQEHRALEDQERTAAREAERLKPIVDDLMAEDIGAYTRVKDLRKDERVLRLYWESLEEQVGAAAALRRRFFSEGDHDMENLDTLEEKKARIAAFLETLGKRASTLELEQEQQNENVPEDESQSAPDGGPSAPLVSEEPPAYPIIDTPHPPCACMANSSDPSTSPGGPPGQCTAIRVRDGKRCTWNCLWGQRFCMIHRVAHGTAVIPHKMAESMLEIQRVKAVRGVGGRPRDVEDVKTYLDRLEDVIAIVEEHQRLFSCRAPEDHTALLSDLKKRRTSAALLHAELTGRKDARMAEKQGQEETWVTEYLVEMRQKEALERQRVAAGVLTGAIVSGASIWFGVPWIQSMVAGAVTASAAADAREDSQAS